jgi:hypothetical protein
MIIGLTGYARTGKDTVGKILVDHHGFRRVAFGDVLKAVAEDTDPIIEICTDDPDIEYSTASVRELLRAYGDWEDIKDGVPEARQYLVDLGNSLRRRIPGVEISAAFAGVKPGEDVVNTNVYHREEIEAIQKMGGVVLRVVRPGIKPANDDEARTGQVTVDATVVNDGSIDKLAVNVDLVIRYLRDQEKP